MIRKGIQILCLALIVVLSAQLANAYAAQRYAHKRHPTTDPVTLAYAKALEYWHATPCNGHVTIGQFTTYTIAEANGGEVQQGIESGALTVNALTSFATPYGANNWQVNPILYTNCTIRFNATIWTSWAQDDEYWHLYCDQMTHEVGHLFGHPDIGVTNRASIQYPIIERGPYEQHNSPNYDAVPQCEHVTIWYGNQRIEG